ncbi:MAG TPA: MFS transporter [Actinomycetota bacterium]|nr:MFS transporter [Actinomycetota bacterium]
MFVLITLSTFAYFVSVGTLLPTLPRYVEGPLAGGSIAVGMAVGAFSLAAVVLRPVVGRVGDTRGRRLLILGGAALVGVSVAAYVLASSLIVLLLLRLVTGAGEAAFYVGGASAINDLAPEERRGEALSFFSLALYAGLALGPVLGETVLNHTHYHSAWIASALCAFVAFLLGVGVPDTREEIEGGSRSGRIIHPAAVLPGTILAAGIVGLTGFNSFVPLYVLTLGMKGSRIVFVVFSAVVLMVRGFGAQLPDRLGPRLSARAALITSAIGLAVMAVWAQPAGIISGTVVFGLGQALAFPALMTIAIRGAPSSERGSVVGTFTAFFDLAYGVGAIGLGAVVSLLGYRGMFAVASAAAVGGLILLFVYAHNSNQTEAAAGSGAGS